MAFSFFLSSFQIFDWTSCHKINLKIQKKNGINKMTLCVLPFFLWVQFFVKMRKLNSKRNVHQISQKNQLKKISPHLNSAFNLVAFLKVISLLFRQV
jgi:hypothetical protein